MAKRKRGLELLLDIRIVVFRSGDRGDTAQYAFWDYRLNSHSAGAIMVEAVARATAYSPQSTSIGRHFRTFEGGAAALGLFARSPETSTKASLSFRTPVKCLEVRCG